MTSEKNGSDNHTNTNDLDTCRGERNICCHPKIFDIVCKSFSFKDKGVVLSTIGAGTEIKDTAKSAKVLKLENNLIKGFQ